MIILGVLFPVLIHALTGSPVRSWRNLRLLSSYLIVFSALQLAADYFSLSLEVRWTILLVLGFLEASNLEHVINNNSNQSFIFIKFLFDPVFLKGSGITKRFFLRLAGIQVIFGLAAYFHPVLEVQTSLLLFAASTLATLAMPKSSILSSWLQENWLIFNVLGILQLRKGQSTRSHSRQDVALSAAKLSQADEEYKKLRPRESGTKWLTQDRKTNVLVIVVEGLGEIHFKKGWMPRLSERRARNITFKRFINHQRNTNRGLYTLYTGKHPNLVDQMAKPDLVAQYGKMDTGLAEVLKTNGYKTVYLQGAPSVFMCKDRFLPHLGFEEVIGEEQYDKAVPRIKWGVDDHELYKRAIAKMQELQAEKRPWFLSLLTLSTHHPIEAANKVLKGPEDGFRYADEELDIFLNQLEASGALENTLVCITSDEVAGDGQHVLSESLGTMVVLSPTKEQKEIDTPFCQSDLAYGLCDYLQIQEHPFQGRSLFQGHESLRPLYFASIFQQRAFLYQEQHLFIQHYSGKREVLKLEDLSFSSVAVPVKDFDPKGFERLNEFVKSNDRGLEFLTTPIIMDLKQLLPTGEKTVKSPGFIKIGLKKGEAIKLKFQGENQHKEMPLVVNWLIQDMKHKRSFKPNIIVLPGHQEGFEKTFISPGDSWYDLTIRVMANENDAWSIKDLQISMDED